MHHEVAVHGVLYVWANPIIRGGVSLVLLSRSLDFFLSLFSVLEAFL